jgi:hypothetical protein
VQAFQETGILDYVPFVFPDGGGALVLVTGYFDESERDDAGSPICVAGFLFKPSGYKAFRRYWASNVLRYRGRRVEPFHMTDLCSGKGVYRDLSISARVEILNHAVHAISKNALGATGMFFKRDEFIAKAPAGWPLLFGSIYTVACHLCVQTTAFWLSEWDIHGDALYVFERGHKFQAEANAFLNGIAGDPETRREFRYRQHIFEDKTEYGLQAADLFSWTMTKAHVADGNPPRAMKPFIDPILRFSDASHGRYRLTRFTGKHLDEFFQMNVNRTRLLSTDRGPRWPTFT